MSLPTVPLSHWSVLFQMITHCSCWLSLLSSCHFRISHPTACTIKFYEAWGICDTNIPPWPVPYAKATVHSRSPHSYNQTSFMTSMEIWPKVRQRCDKPICPLNALVSWFIQLSPIPEVFMMLSFRGQRLQWPDLAHKLLSDLSCTRVTNSQPSTKQQLQNTQDWQLTVLGLHYMSKPQPNKAQRWVYKKQMLLQGRLAVQRALLISLTHTVNLTTVT